MQEQKPPTLQPAEENPQYVLATICAKDKVMPVDGTMEMQIGLHRLMSRDIWNAWAFSELRDEQKVILEDERPDLVEDLLDQDKISTEIYKRFANRCKKGCLLGEHPPGSLWESDNARACASPCLKVLRVTSRSDAQCCAMPGKS